MTREKINHPSLHADIQIPNESRRLRLTSRLVIEITSTISYRDQQSDLIIT